MIRCRKVECSYVRTSTDLFYLLKDSFKAHQIEMVRAELENKMLSVLTAMSIREKTLVFSLDYKLKLNLIGFSMQLTIYKNYFSDVELEFTEQQSYWKCLPFLL